MLTCQTTPMNPAILAADSPDNHTPCYPCAQVPAASDSGSYLFPCWAGKQKQPLPSQGDGDALGPTRLMVPRQPRVPVPSPIPCPSTQGTQKLLQIIFFFKPFLFLTTETSFSHVARASLLDSVSSNFVPVKNF